MNLAIGWLEEELEEDELGIVEGLEEDALEEFVEDEVPKLDACDELVLLDSEEEVRAPHPDKAKDAKPRIARSLNRFVFIKLPLFLFQEHRQFYKRTAFSGIGQQTQSNTKPRSLLISIVYLTLPIF